jgi:signal peptidase
MDPEKRQSYKTGAISFLKEIAVAAIAVGIIMGGLYAYSGVWPPLVVVESGSMQHSDTESSVGVIDTGDMVLVRSIKRHEQVSSYIDGRENGLRNYGDYGHVIVYRPYGDTSKVPIIHRAVAWVEVNDSRVQPLPGGAIDYANYSFDVPVLGVLGLNIYEFTIPDYGYGRTTITIDLRTVLRFHESLDTLPHDGFITAGDHNIVKYHGGYDQLTPTICADLVAPEWIIGVAFGEIPWVGLLKLMVSGGAGSDVPSNSWWMLGIAIFLVLAVPFSVDLLLPKAKAWWRKRRGPGPGGSGTKDLKPDDCALIDQPEEGGGKPSNPSENSREKPGAPPA